MHAVVTLAVVAGAILEIAGFQVDRLPRRTAAQQIQAEVGTLGQAHSLDVLSAAKTGSLAFSSDDSKELTAWVNDLTNVWKACQAGR